MGYIASASVLLAAAMAWSPPAPGSTVLQVSLAELARLSEAVVLGEIKARSFRQDADRVVWTDYEMVVSDVFAGEFGESVLSFNCIGGSIGSETFVVQGTPGFETGEKVLLFYDDNHTQCPVAGGQQGAFVLGALKDGREVLTDYHGRVVERLSENDVVRSSARVPRVVATDAPALAGTGSADVVEGDEGAIADAAELLDELKEFAAFYVTKPERIVSRTRVLPIQTPVAPPVEGKP